MYFREETPSDRICSWIGTPLLRCRVVRQKPLGLLSVDNLETALCSIVHVHTPGSDLEPPGERQQHDPSHSTTHLSETALLSELERECPRSPKHRVVTPLDRRVPELSVPEVFEQDFKCNLGFEPSKLGTKAVVSAVAE